MPAGTILVLRTHPDLTSEYTSAISVRLDDDIVWNTFPYLCRVSHRGIRPDYHTNSTFMNLSRISMPLCVPIPLLLLETDWPLPSLHQHATLYGCPRLQRGRQVSLNSSSSFFNNFIQVLFATACDFTTSHLLHHYSDCGPHKHIVRVGDFWNCDSILQTPAGKWVNGIWLLVLGFVAKTNDCHVSCSVLFFLHTTKIVVRRFIFGLQDAISSFTTKLNCAHSVDSGQINSTQRTSIRRQFTTNTTLLGSGLC